MPTVSELWFDIGTRIGDPSNTRAGSEAWQLLRWINTAVKDVVKKTDCLWTVEEVSGQKRIEVLDYTNLSSALISLKTSADTVATIYTEAVEWNAATSNSTTATNIATALNLHSNVSAYADGAYVYLCCTGGYVISTLTCNADAAYLTISDDGYETFELNNVISNFRRVKHIYDTANEIIYRPLDEQTYDRVLCDSNYTGYSFHVSPSYKLYIKAAGANLTSDLTFKISYLYWHTALTAATDNLPSILNHHEEIVIERVLYYYFKSNGMYKEMNMSDITYRQLARDLQTEIRTQGELVDMAQVYQWH